MVPLGLGGDPLPPLASVRRPWRTAPATPLTLKQGLDALILLHALLQVFFCVVLVLQGLSLFGRLRQIWIGDGLAGEFRRELRRRGLLINAPRPPIAP